MAVGRKTGGRKKGTKNKATIEREKVAKARLLAAKSEGLTPLEYMLKVMRDSNAPLEDRFAAAKEAAPYIHPKLSAIEYSGPDGKPIETETVHKLDAASLKKLNDLVG